MASKKMRRILFITGCIVSNVNALRKMLQQDSPVSSVVILKTLPTLQKCNFPAMGLTGRADYPTPGAVVAAPFFV